VAVTYKLIDNELVSQEWYIVLMDMRRAGVCFHVNEGKRTMARQQYFWNCYQTGSCNGGHVAARPSPFAPHIREGRIDHAIDFSNDPAVFRWLQNNGLHPVRTVSGESWHIECPASALRGYAKTHGVGDPVLHYGHRGPSVVKLKKLLYANGVRNFSGESNSNRYNPFFGTYTKSAVVRFQSRNGLVADGVVGPSTWKRLRA
jgi:hypothetical protein